MTYISTVFASSARHDRTRKAGRLRTFPLVNRVLDWAERYSLRHSTIQALGNLSDRQLCDIGVDRTDVSSIVDERLEALRRL